MKVFVVTRHDVFHDSIVGVTLSKDEASIMIDKEVTKEDNQCTFTTDCFDVDIHIVAIGDPFAGMALHGPFPSLQDASDWSEKVDTDCWVIPVSEPD